MVPSDWLARDLPPDLRSHVQRAGDLTRAWRSCPRPDWLLRMAMEAGLGRAALVRAAAGLVTEALCGLSVPDLRVRRALMVSLRWVAGRATAREAWACGFAATEAANGMQEPREEAAARAAALLAFACDEDADDVFYAHRGYAVKSAERCTLVLDASGAAERIRSEIPLASFLEAAELRSRTVHELPPAPPPAETTDSFYC